MSDVFGVGKAYKYLIPDQVSPYFLWPIQELIHRGIEHDRNTTQGSVEIIVGGKKLHYFFSTCFILYIISGEILPQ